ncbi:MAG: hypothetical protein GY789_02310 [Hyphomicrobiales bacterium]|nr:hypothetical protein [Hyphomicrobiales bacterium]
MTLSTVNEMARPGHRIFSAFGLSGFRFFSLMLQDHYAPSRLDSPYIVIQFWIEVWTTKWPTPFPQASNIWLFLLLSNPASQIIMNPVGRRLAGFFFVMGQQSLVTSPVPVESIIEVVMFSRKFVGEKSQLLHRGVHRICCYFINATI